MFVALASSSLSDPYPITFSTHSHFIMLLLYFQLTRSMMPTEYRVFWYILHFCIFLIQILIQDIGIDDALERKC